MKIKLLFLSFLFISFTVFSQITAGQTSGFQDGTTQGWKHSNSNANDPINVPDLGPLGVGDNIVRVTNSGGGGPGSRHIMINNNAEWIGDYTSAGILALTFDVQNNGANDLHLRVAMHGTMFADWISNSAALVIPSGTTWTSVTIPISASDMVVSQGTASVATVLANATEVRILSNDGTDVNTPLHKGQKIVLISEYDNIVATDVLSINDIENVNNEFTIIPNPSKDRLNVFLPNSLENATLLVFDVLGKKIYSSEINNFQSSIKVSDWNTGVYLVRISTDDITQTKRFIKQ